MRGRKISQFSFFKAAQAQQTIHGASCFLLGDIQSPGNPPGRKLEIPERTRLQYRVIMPIGDELEFIRLKRRIGKRLGLEPTELLMLKML